VLSGKSSSQLLWRGSGNNMPEKLCVIEVVATVAL
jgi:hypothetical protein